MWVPLAVLAVLATIGGFVGISHAFKFITGNEHPGARLNIVNWLDPVIWNPSTGRFGRESGAEVRALEERNKQAAGREAVREEGSSRAPLPTESEESPRPYGDTGFNLAHAVQGVLGGSHAAAEWFFIVFSVAVAAFGMWLGYFFYIKRPHLPDLWAARLSTLYRASFNKYWIDEIYGALVTRRTADLSRGVHAADSRGIDGAVNGAAWLTRQLSRLTGAADRLVVDGAVNAVAGFIKLLMSPLLRAAQTGITANYALVMILGLMAGVFLFFGKDMLHGIAEALRGLGVPV